MRTSVSSCQSHFLPFSRFVQVRLSWRLRKQQFRNYFHNFVSILSQLWTSSFSFRVEKKLQPLSELFLFAIYVCPMFLFWFLVIGSYPIPHSNASFKHENSSKPIRRTHYSFNLPGDLRWLRRRFVCFCWILCKRVRTFV